MNKQAAKQAHQTQTSTPVSGMLQRKCACGQHTIAGTECEGCGQQRLQRRAIGHSETGEVPPIVNEVLRSRGQPLDPITRDFMESRFSHDFSQVRVHIDAKAAESAVAVNALAYTVGRNVVFAAGQYAPASTTGKKILAHELTHVVQQRKGVIAPLNSDGATIVRDASYEREADAQSALVGEGKPANRGFHQGENMDAGTTPAQAIQLLEKSTTSPAQAGGGTNTAQAGQGNSNPAATDDQGKGCMRLYVPGVSGGQVTWEGISQETLDKHVRLKPEEGTVLVKATANSTNTCDAVYFGSAYGRFILKVPDHCTVTFKNSFSKWSSCCSNFGAWLAAKMGKARAPRPGTADEFGAPNDWEPAKAPNSEPVKPPQEPEQKTKGTPIPLKG